MSLNRPFVIIIEFLIFILVVGGLGASAFYPRILSWTHTLDHAQIQDPPPVHPRDYHFGVASPGKDIVWAVGDQGRIVRSFDGGATWTLQSSGVKRNLMDIAAWGSQRAVTVGNEAIVLRTEDGGGSWQNVKEVPRSRISNKLYRVQIAPDGSAWALGERNAILRSDDHGRTWKRMIEEGRNSWYGISFVSDTRAVVVGEFGEMALGQRKDGSWSWHSKTLPVEQSLKSVDFRDDSLGVAVGLNGLILRTSDGGKTWETLKIGIRNHLFTVRWYSNRWVALGAQGVVVEGTPSARSWKAARLSPREFGWHVSQIPFGDEGNILSVGANIGLLKGQNWTKLNS